MSACIVERVLLLVVSKLLFSPLYLLFGFLVSSDIHVTRHLFKLKLEARPMDLEVIQVPENVANYVLSRLLSGLLTACIITGCLRI